MVAICQPDRSMFFRQGDGNHGRPIDHAVYLKNNRRETPLRLAVVERPAVHEGAAAAFRQPTAYNIRVNRAQRLIEAGS